MPDWSVIVLGDRQRPQTWTELKEVMRAHFNAVSEVEAIERLRRARQLTAAQDFLVTFSKAAAECPNL